MNRNRQPVNYDREILIGLGLGAVIGTLLLSGWLGRIMGAAAVILGS
jgi:hypothetical protein